jgi:hypothetical protein
MWTCLAIAAVLAALGVVSLGLPGGLVLVALRPLLVRLYPPGREVYEDERLWPAALLTSVLGPLVVPLSWAIAPARLAWGTAALSLIALVPLAVGVLWFNRKVG